jgi:hypothetical protein
MVKPPKAAIYRGAKCQGGGVSGVVYPSKFKNNFLGVKPQPPLISVNFIYLIGGICCNVNP